VLEFTAAASLLATFLFSNAGSLLIACPFDSEAELAHPLSHKKQIIKTAANFIWIYVFPFPGIFFSK
jgi:hypothetical protein